MCGILGVVMDQSNSLGNSFEDSLRLLDHRGPDNRGTYYDTIGHSRIALGHTRLSILDLSASANQPFTSSCGRYVLVYNGEIYNYQELGKNLLPDQVMQTSSDTEVLLWLYIRYGEKMLNMLDGMFAFALLDRKNNTLFCARDQLGIKPLYYIADSEKFAFSSEIKPLFSLTGEDPKLDKYAVYEFIRNSFVYEPGTGFEGVNKLGAGEYCIVELDDRKIIKRLKYWLPWDKKHNNSYSIEKHVRLPNSLHEELRVSIRRQLRSDVPVGLFFSGGVDSTIILAELQSKVASMTVKNNKKHMADSGQTNDYKYALQVADHFGVELREIEFQQSEDGEEFLKNVRRMAFLSEELLSDYTFMASMSLSKAAKEMGYTVMLSGMGADEIFGGYSRYRLVMYPRIYCFFGNLFAFILGKQRGFDKKIERLKRFCRCDDFADKYTSILGYFSKKDAESYLFYRPEFEELYRTRLNNIVSDISSPFKKAVYLDVFGFLAHNFSVADKSSMQESVELRVPLVTKRLFELSFELPASSLSGMFRTKKPLRKFLEGKVPGNIINRKKTGFHPPMDNVIRSIGRARIIFELKQAQIGKIIDITFIERILAEHFDGRKNNTYGIFQLLYLAYWYQAFFVDVENR